jgi:hypothetical protein
MVIYTSEDMAEQPEATQADAIQAKNPALLEDTTLAHFCEFVDFYTRHAKNPMCMALACEQQAEAIRITNQDLCPETIQLLIETMLTAIDHLEKKWLDEQIRWEDLEQRHRRDLAHPSARTLVRNHKVKRSRKQKPHRITHLFSQGPRWVWQRFRRGKKHVPQQHPSHQKVVAW